MRSPGLHNHRVLQTRPPLLHPWYWPCRPWYSSSPRQSWTRRSQIWKKKSLYLYFKKFIDIFIFIYFINKFWAIFFTSPWAPGTGSGTSRPSRWRPCPWVLHCGCSLQEGLQGPGGGPGGPGQGQGEDDHSSSPHHFPQTGCTLEKCRLSLLEIV